MEMDQQTAWLLATISLGGISGIVCLAETLVKRMKASRRRISAAKLNDCKPGCFMSNRRWEDLT